MYFAFIFRSNFRELTKLIYEQISVEGNKKKGKITHKNLNQQISQQGMPRYDAKVQIYTITPEYQQ